MPIVHVASSPDMLHDMLSKCRTSDTDDVTLMRSPTAISGVSRSPVSPIATSPSAFKSQLAAEGYATAFEQLIDNEALCDVAFEVEGALSFV